MPVIDPYGLFHGQRLAACSDFAQLCWPRFFCAANSCARLELHLPSIINQCFNTFQSPPSETAVWSVFQEYNRHYLAMAYRVNGHIWVQFVTEEKYLKKYKGHDDERTPAPPEREFEAYKNRYAELKKRQAKNQSATALESLSEVFQTSFENFSNEIGHGVGVGVGVGEGRGDGGGMEEVADAGASSSSASDDPLSSVGSAVEANGKIIAASNELSSLDAFFDSYDKHRGEMRPCRERTKKRKDCLRQRIRDGLTLARWNFGVAEGAATPFCCGKNARKQVWTIDNLLDEDSFAKLMEGKYRDAKPAQRIAPSVAGLKALGERHG